MNVVEFYEKYNGDVEKYLKSIQVVEEVPVVEWPVEAEIVPAGEDIVDEVAPVSPAKNDESELANTAVDITEPTQEVEATSTETVTKSLPSIEQQESHPSPVFVKPIMPLNKVTKPKRGRKKKVIEEELETIHEEEENEVVVEEQSAIRYPKRSTRYYHYLNRRPTQPHLDGEDSSFSVMNETTSVTLADPRPVMPVVNTPLKTPLKRAYDAIGLNTSSPTKSPLEIIKSTEKRKKSKLSFEDDGQVIEPTSSDSETQVEKSVTEIVQFLESEIGEENIVEQVTPSQILMPVSRVPKVEVAKQAPVVADEDIWDQKKFLATTKYDILSYRRKAPKVPVIEKRKKGKKRQRKEDSMEEIKHDEVAIEAKEVKLDSVTETVDDSLIANSTSASVGEALETSDVSETTTFFEFLIKGKRERLIPLSPQLKKLQRRQLSQKWQPNPLRCQLSKIKEGKSFP